MSRPQRSGGGRVGGGRREGDGYRNSYGRNRTYSDYRPAEESPYGGKYNSYQQQNNRSSSSYRRDGHHNNQQQYNHHNQQKHGAYQEEETYYNASGEIDPRPRDISQQQDDVIKYVAQYVVFSVDGARYQNKLIAKTRHNPYFSFLTSPNHKYLSYYQYLLQAYQAWRDEQALIAASEANAAKNSNTDVEQDGTGDPSSGTGGTGSGWEGYNNNTNNNNQAEYTADDTEVAQPSASTAKTAATESNASPRNAASLLPAPKRSRDGTEIENSRTGGGAAASSSSAGEDQNSKAGETVDGNKNKEKEKDDDGDDDDEDDEEDDESMEVVMVNGVPKLVPKSKPEEE